MRRGLHIGIGSWIHANHGGADGLALPGSAIPFKLRLPHEVETPEDIAALSELAHFANRLGDGSWRYEPSGPVQLLWDRYRDVASNMETAVSSLTAAQRKQLDAANNVLYGEDGVTMSAQYALYMEARRNHEDLVIAGASVAEVNGAFEAWVTVGHKAAVESAIATKTTLSDVTSRVAVADDLSHIEVALESSGADLPYVPTQFVPISATSTDHWSEAEVDFQSLEDAIGTDVPRSEWKLFRARKHGRVRFRFIAVDLVRPWLSETIFEADDWRLAADVDGSVEIVADGLGRVGRLPAYYSTLYLAQIIDVRNDTVKPKRPPAAASPGNFIASHSIGLSTAHLASSVLLSNTQLFRPTRRGTHSRSATRAFGVVSGATISAASFNAVATIASTRRISSVKLLTSAMAMKKLSFALHTFQQGTTEKPPLPNPTWLVGFGRVHVPRCPNPNPNYQWA